MTVQTSKNGYFSVELTVVLMASIIIIDLFSILDWTKGVTSILLPFKVETSVVLILLSFFGIYGFLKDSRSGIYITILTCISWTIFAVFSLLDFYSNFLDFGFVTSSIAVAVFGFISVVCIFRDDRINIGASINGTVVKHFQNGNDMNLEVYAIDINKVEKKYFLGSNAISAVNDLSLRVRKGEFVSIMGPSGSGKSTLLNLLGALDKPTSGQILIDGIDISLLNEEKLANLRNEKIGFVFQAYNLISRSTVLRNLELPALVKGTTKMERQRKVNELLGIVGLGDKMLRKPKTMSGGEQQRVAIARALINNPEILLADEPTGNVDTKTGAAIMGFLRRLNLEKRTTIIVVTHDPEVAKLTDRVIYIRDGKVYDELGDVSA